MDRGLIRRRLKWAEAAKGPKLFPYHDTVGKLTIGYGRNLDDTGITVKEAEFMLSTDIEEAIDDADNLPYWDSLDSVRQNIVVAMVFNLGLTKFLRFIRLNKALAIQDYSLAAHEMVDSRWYQQTYRRAKLLVKSMQTGVWENATTHPI